GGGMGERGERAVHAALEQCVDVRHLVGEPVEQELRRTAVQADDRNAWALCHGFDISGGWGSVLYRAVNALRRVLYLQAALWVLVGVALAAVPRFVLVTLFDQPPHQEVAWLRALGVESIGLALVTVLVAHRVEELWWWSWAFVLVAAATAAVALLNAAFGLAPHQSSV